MMIGVWILWITLLVLMVWGVRSFFSYTESHGKLIGKHNSALDILHERLVRGEIDDYEFEVQRKMLSQ